MSQASRKGWAAKRAAALARLSPDSPASSDPSKTESTSNGGQGESGGSETLKETGRELSVAGNLSPDECLERAADFKRRKGEIYEKTMARVAEKIATLAANMTDAELLAHSDRIAKLDAVARRNLGLGEADSAQRAPLVQIQLLAVADRNPVPKPCGSS